MGTGHKEGGKFHPHTNSNNGMSSDKIEKKKAVNPNWKVNRDNEQHLSPDEIEKFMDLIIYDIGKILIREYDKVERLYDEGKIDGDTYRTLTISLEDERFNGRRIVGSDIVQNADYMKIPYKERLKGY